MIKSRERYSRKGNDLDKRIQDRLEWVEDRAKADIYLLPLLWNSYYKQKREGDALAFCHAANAEGKTVLSTSGGDQGITVPVPDNVIVYRQSGYRSKRKPTERTAPFLLSDPVTEQRMIDKAKLFEPTGNGKPVVGFCGMAPHGFRVELKERLQIAKRNLKSILGLTADDVQRILSSSSLRFKTLNSFASSAQFETNYVIRTKYRAGAQTAESREQTTREYYSNQAQSDLIICVRGVGNFSTRFFETLAMGRIPVFIDTDSPLPDISPLSWHDHIVWVNAKDINKAPEQVAEWLENKDLEQQKRANRQLWVDRFRGDNYWLNELERLS